MSKTVSYTDIIKDIEGFYAETAFDVWCPWAGISLKYKPLSVQQFKEFIEVQIASAKEDSSAVEASLSVIEKLNAIITGNCLSDNKDLLSTLTTVDRDAIIVQLRANTKPETDVVTDSNETVTVNLNDIVTGLQGKTPDNSIRSTSKLFEFGSNSIELELEVPTLERDGKINEAFKGKVKSQISKNKKQPNKDSEKLLSEIYFIEICKYIKELAVNKGDERNVVKFEAGGSMHQSLKVLEKLPSSIVAATAAYIANVKDYRDSYLYYIDPESDDQVSLEVDANMFTGI
jgi:hypothetical protein